MTSSQNPYQPPSDWDHETDRETFSVRGEPKYLDRGHRWMLGLWPIALLLNIVFPGLIALGICNRSGIVGVVAAILLFLVAGFWICLRYRRYGRGLILGAGLVSLTQFFPILQMILGMFAVGFAAAMGLAEDSDFDGMGGFIVTSMMGGFLVTMLVGGGLAGLGLLVGRALIWLFEKRQTAARTGV